MRLGLDGGSLRRAGMCQWVSEWRQLQCAKHLRMRRWLGWIRLRDSDLHQRVCQRWGLHSAGRMRVRYWLVRSVVHNASLYTWLL